MSILIPLEIGLYLLVPYYLGLLTLDKKKIYKHILIWFLCNAIFVFIFSWKEKEIVTLPLVVLGFGLIYFVCSYLFNGRNLQKEADIYSIKTLISNKKVLLFSYIVFTGIVIFSVLLLLYIMMKMNNLLYIAYFLILILNSCIEIILYFKEIMKNVRNI